MLNVVTFYILILDGCKKQIKPIFIYPRKGRADETVKRHDLYIHQAEVVIFEYNIDDFIKLYCPRQNSSLTICKLKSVKLIKKLLQKAIEKTF
ncbi:MAG: hypothetical protein EGP82_00450 [Odoribacter splanchnicus]|nr:hypothetical protein [Odoribacter splanchnicus]